MRFRHGVSVAGAVAALLVSGCSRADTGGAATAASSTTQEVSASSTTQEVSASTVQATDSATGSSAADDVTTATPQTSTARSKEQGDPIECLSAANALSAVSSGFLKVLQEQTGPEPFDPASVISGLAQARLQAPAAIQPDLDRISGAATSLKGKTLDDATKVYNSPDVAAATSHLESWVPDHC